MKSMKLDSLGLRPEVIEIFRSELESILSFRDTIHRLDGALRGFNEQLQQETRKNEFLDTEKALSVHSLSLALLSLCKKNPFAEHLPYSLAAISYFALAHDVTPDFESFDGFEDDESVLKSVIAHFNLQKEIESELHAMKLKESSGE